MTSRVPEKKKEKKKKGISYENRVLRRRDLFLTTVISPGILSGSRIIGHSHELNVHKVCLVIFFMQPKRSVLSHKLVETRGPFLESPGNLTGPKSYFEIKVSRTVGCVLTSNEVHFVFLADNFTAPSSKLLKLPSLIKNKTT